MRIQCKENIRPRGIQVKHKPLHAKIFKEFGKDVWTLSCEVKRPDEMRTIDLWKTVGLEDIQVAH